MGGILDIEGNHLKFMADPAHNRHDISNVDAKWAVHGAPFTKVALGVGNYGGLVDEFRGDSALFFG